jgi:hypothetical protein
VYGRGDKLMEWAVSGRKLRKYARESMVEGCKIRCRYPNQSTEYQIYYSPKGWPGASRQCRENLCQDGPYAPPADDAACIACYLVAGGKPHFRPNCCGANAHLFDLTVQNPGFPPVTTYGIARWRYQPIFLVRNSAFTTMPMEIPGELKNGGWRWTRAP